MEPKTLNLYGIEVQAGDYCRLKEIADMVFGFTLVDTDERKARKASVYKAVSIDLDLREWAKSLPAKDIPEKYKAEAREAIRIASAALDKAEGRIE